MNKKKRIALLIISFIVGGFVVFLLLFTFILARPISGEITEDSIILQKLCDMQFLCRNSNPASPCEIEWDSRDFNKLEDWEVSRIMRLQKWDNYKGCNESTPGFMISGEHKYVRPLSCVCGNLF